MRLGNFQTLSLDASAWGGASGYHHRGSPPLPLPARHERGEGWGGAGERGIELATQLTGSPLPHPLPTPPSWGEGIDQRHGGGVFPLDTRRLALDISVGCGGKPAAAWRTHRAKPHDDHPFIWRIQLAL